MSCEKDTNRSANAIDNKQDVELLKLAIKEWGMRKNNTHTKSIIVYNTNNPMDEAGIRHNKQLDSVSIQIGFDTLTLTNLLSYYENNYGVNIIIDESQVINRINYFQNNILTSDGLYNPSFVNGLVGITQEEKEVLNSYYSVLKTVVSLQERIAYSKYLEDVIISSNFGIVAKNRMLRAFSIFRHSTYFWDKYYSTQEGLQNGGGMADVMDSIAAYWATNCDHEVGVFEDGASVNTYASEVSLMYTIIEGLL